MNDSHPTYRPRRHLRNEIYSLALVLAAPVGVIAVFPFAAFSFHPDAHDAQQQRIAASCSFVELTEKQADSAVEAARSAIKTAQDGISALRTDLSLSAIPLESGGVAELAERVGPPPMADADYDVLPLPPTLAAPAPKRIPLDPSATNYPSAFSRDNLLEIWDY